MVDEFNKSYYRNTLEGRRELLEDCQAMSLMDAYNEVMTVWGDKVPSRALDELRRVKLFELESSFDARVSGEFLCSLGWPMQFDRSDTLAVVGAIQLMRANGQSAGYLTDASDVTHYDLPLATIEAIKLEMLAAYAACHARKQELRSAINGAATAEELAAIEITWPV